MGYITDKGIILMVLITDLLIIISISITLLLARLLSGKQPNRSERVIRLVTVISPTIVIVFGMLAETIIVFVVLWTVGII